MFSSLKIKSIFFKLSPLDSGLFRRTTLPNVEVTFFAAKFFISSKS